MPILHHKHAAGFTVIPNDLLQNKALSLRELGLLCYMLSLPENWRFSCRGLASALPNDGRDAIRKSVKQLEAAGYLEIRQSVSGAGRFTGCDWYVSDVPCTACPEADSPWITAPETAARFSAAPEAAARSSAAPEAPARSSAAPEAETTEPLCPESPESESGKPEYGKPEYGKPEYGKPEYGKPEYGKPEYGKPESGNPTQQNNKQQNNKQKNNKQQRGNPRCMSEQVPGPDRRVSGQRCPHGQYGNVLLSQSELAQLRAEFPEDWERGISRLSGYMRAKGKRYADHYATIRMWLYEDLEKRTRASPVRCYEVCEDSL